MAPPRSTSGLADSEREWQYPRGSKSQSFQLLVPLGLWECRLVGNSPQPIRLSSPNTRCQGRRDCIWGRDKRSNDGVSCDCVWCNSGRIIQIIPLCSPSSLDPDGTSKASDVASSTGLPSQAVQSHRRFSLPPLRWCTEREPRWMDMP